MVKRLSLILALLTVSLPALAVSKVTASLDRQSVAANEPVQLTVLADARLAEDALDLSPLEKDFRVEAPVVSRAAEFNGTTFLEQTQWRIKLVPKKKKGRVQIPSLQLDELVTAPIMLSIQDKQASQAPDLLLQVETSSDTAYVGAQLGYKVRLLVARDLKSGQTSMPVMKGAEVRLLGEEKESQDTYQGRDYRIFTRDYAIFPQEAGNGMIEGPVFTGELFEQDARGFYQTRDISKVAPPRQVVIKGPPPGNQPWLPAQELHLEERWSRDPQNWQVGDPLTRTLVLTAKGTQASVMPPLDFATPQGVKRYPDENQRDSFVKDGWLHAQQLLSIALVPTQAGELVLPAVDVVWFDVQSGQFKTQRLPKKRLTISPAPQPQMLVGETPPPASTGSGYWPWLSALLTLGWLGTLYYLVRSRRKEQQQAQADDQSPAWLSLRHALLGQDPHRAARLLLNWARDRYGVQSLEALAEHLDSPPLGQQLAQLQRHRFDAKQASWDGKAILAALTEAKKKKPAPLPGDGLYAHLKL